MPRHRHDLLRAEASGSQHRTQADRAVTNNGHRASLAHTSRYGGVVAGAHDVGQREQARHHGVVRLLWGRYQRAVGQRDSRAFPLRAVDQVPVLVGRAPVGAVQARRRDAVAAVEAGAVAQRERRDHEVTLLDRGDRRTYFFHYSDELVTDAAWLLRQLNTAIGPQVRAADAARDRAHHHIGRKLKSWLGDLVEPDVTRAVDHAARIAPG